MRGHSKERIQDCRVGRGPLLYLQSGAQQGYGGLEDKCGPHIALYCLQPYLLQFRLLPVLFSFPQ